MNRKQATSAMGIPAFAVSEYASPQIFVALHQSYLSTALKTVQLGAAQLELAGVYSPDGC